MFRLESGSFDSGEAVPRRFTCEGDDVSPKLTWYDLPEGTESLALVMDDPDAPAGTFTHWLVADISADASGLEEGSASGVPGRNDFRKVGYGGPCPPRGHGAHRYFFNLYALNVAELGLGEGFSRSELESAMKVHVLGTAELVGIYER